MMPRYMRTLARAACIAVVTWCATGPVAVHAVALNYGELTGSFDTTLSWGMSVRTQDQETIPTSIYGQRELFPDAWDIITHQVKASHELELRNSQWGDATWGLFLRGNYFYDFEMANQPLPDAAENRAEQHGDITDAFVWFRFGPDDRLMLRVGKQVISWGESTFFQGSINEINTVDFTKLRQPGSAIKDAFIGVRSIYGQWEVSPVVTLEAFYLLEFQELLLDPVGNFFGTNDRVRDGGGFPNGIGPSVGGQFDGCLTPDSAKYAAVGINVGCSFGPITRIGDDIPSGSGQYGVALRWFAADFLSGFDFGFYYQRLHDRNGYLSTIVGGTPSVFGPAPMSPRFFMDYARGVDRFGFSFNTEVGGWAIGGELGYRHNEPTQNAQALLSAPLDGILGPSTGAFGPVGSKFVGYERFKRYQYQMTFQRNFGPVAWARTDQFRFLAEMAYGWVEDFPDTKTDGGGNIVFSKFNPVSKDWSAVQIRTSQEYNRALFNFVNVRFEQALAWDIDGVSTEISPLFREDRKRFTLGFRFSWLDSYSASISHTWDWGGEDHRRPGPPLSNGGGIFNPVGDFLRMNFSYSF